MAKAKWMLSEAVKEESTVTTDEIPDVDMDAITAAINNALGGVEEEVSSAGEEEKKVEEFLEKVAPEAKKKEKAKKLTLKSLGGKKDKPTDEGKSLAVEGEVKERKPRTSNPKLSHYGTPIIRSAKDKCSSCAAIVKWHSTTDGAGNPIWICDKCGREVPRRVPVKK